MPAPLVLPTPGVPTVHNTKVVTGSVLVTTSVPVSRDLLLANNAQIVKTYGRTLTQMEASNYHFTFVEILAIIEGRSPTTGVQSEFEAKRVVQSRYPWAF